MAWYLFAQPANLLTTKPWASNNAAPLVLLLQVLAPTDAAFDQLLTNLGGASGQPLPLDALLAQPTLKDILLYHIIPGRYTSGEFLLTHVLRRWLQMTLVYRFSTEDKRSCHVMLDAQAQLRSAHLCRG